MIFEQIGTAGDRNFAYLVGDESTKKAAVFDPSFTPEKVPTPPHLAQGPELSPLLTAIPLPPSTRGRTSRSDMTSGLSAFKNNLYSGEPRQRTPLKKRTSRIRRSG